MKIQRKQNREAGEAYCRRKVVRNYVEPFNHDITKIEEAEIKKGMFS